MSKRETENTKRFFAVMALIMVLSSATAIAPEINPFTSAIKQSLNPTVFAEGDYYGQQMCGLIQLVQDPDTLCDPVTPLTVCVAENSTNNITLHASVVSLTGSGISPDTINSFSAAQYIDSAVLTLTPDTVSSPTNVTSTTSLGEQTTASYTFAIGTPDITAQSATESIVVGASGSTFVSQSTSGMGTYMPMNVKIINQPAAPVVTGLSSGDLTAGTGGTFTLPVAAHYENPNGQPGVLTFEASTDNFATIAKTVVVGGVASGTTTSTQLPNLPLGEYVWRVTAAEQDLATICNGATIIDPSVATMLALRTTAIGSKTSNNYTKPPEPVPAAPNTGLSNQNVTFPPILATTLGGISTLITAVLLVWRTHRRAPTSYRR